MSRAFVGKIPYRYLTMPAIRWNRGRAWCSGLVSRATLLIRRFWLKPQSPLQISSSALHCAARTYRRCEEIFLISQQLEGRPAFFEGCLCPLRKSQSSLIFSKTTCPRTRGPLPRISWRLCIGCPLLPVLKATSACWISWRSSPLPGSALWSISAKLWASQLLLKGPARRRGLSSTCSSLLLGGLSLPLASFAHSKAVAASVNSKDRSRSTCLKDVAAP